MDAPRLTLADLRGLVTDADELKKGVTIFDGNGLSLLSRHELRLFCEAAGSGAAPYRVSVAFDEAGAAKARCTCMAARSRPVCKHAAALLVAWARAPEAFAVSEAPPPEPGGGARKRSVKTGKTDAKELLARGVEQAGTLVRELAVSGVASMGPGRTDGIRALAAALREARLRRLSAKAVALADLLDAGQRGALDAPAYTGLLADMLLAVRKLEKHLAGEPLEERHAEELVGRSWRKEDRTPAQGLDLVEYAYLARETPDGFVIRESRMLDLASGQHQSQKQILPAFLVKRTEPLRSRAGQRLRGAAGSVYPGYPPRRLDLEDPGKATPLDAESVRAVAAAALPSVGAALGAFGEHRRDPFAPDRFPVAVRADALLARGGRLLAVDAQGAALHLPGDPAVEERLAAALRGTRLLALLGDVDLESALPVLTPLAAAVEGSQGAALVPLGVPADALGAGTTQGSALESARRAGASGAAIALAEVREELAHLLSTGLSAVVPRATDALSARLRDLGLGKPADLLDTLARRPEPGDRLDDLVKVYQVLEIALLRLLGAVEVDRGSLEPSPTFESVLVPRPERPLPPDEVRRLQGAGRLSRYEAAWHLDRHYGSMSPGALAGEVFGAWADGGAAPLVVRACAALGEPAVDAALRALRGRGCRIAKLTAVKVLEAVGGERAREALERALDDPHDGLLRHEAAAAVAALVARSPAPPRAGLADRLRSIAGRTLRHGQDERRLPDVEAWLVRLRDEPQQEQRLEAVRALADAGDRAALPALRSAAASDPAQAVRLGALRALGALADTDSLDALVRLLEERAQDDDEAKAAAEALGAMGDLRGLAPLLAAFVEGWKPTVIADALLGVGPAAVGPLVGELEERPELAARKVSTDLLERMPAEDLSRVLLERLGSLRPRLALRQREETWPKAAAVYLKLAAVHPSVEAAVATAVLAMVPAPATKEEKALRRAAEKALAPPAPAREKVTEDG